LAGLGAERANEAGLNTWIAPVQRTISSVDAADPAVITRTVALTTEPGCRANALKNT